MAADTNADHKIDVTDVKHGDVVLVQARVATSAPDAAAITARKLVDKTNATVDDEGKLPMG